MSSEYIRGRRFEYRVKRLLEKHGYRVVRAASSKGPADLVAFRKVELLLVQCKIGDWHTREDWNELVAIARETGAVPIFAQAKNRKTNLWIMERKTGKRRRNVLRRAYPLAPRDSNRLD